MRLPSDLNIEAKRLLYSVADLEQRTALYEAWVERAGICEFDGCMTRADAEAIANEELKETLSIAEGV